MSFYALKQPDGKGSEWIQEFDSREEAVSFQSHSGGVLVRRERVPGQPGLWWVEVTYTPSGLDEFHPDTTHNPNPEVP